VTAPPIIDLPSPNFDDRPGGPSDIDMLILHYTGMQTGQAAIDRLRDPVAKVSSHYVVEEDGTIFRLVPEHLRAFHAGISYWRGRHTLNGVCIGIEIVNPGHEWGYRPFPAVQMEAVKNLCLAILGRHTIPPCNIIGHSDVAPNRKQDPGELFDWKGLAGAGIGFWPEDDGRRATPDRESARAALAAIGYETTWPLETVVTAFQRHFLPKNVTGLLDEATMGRILAVSEK
jgi:N-acetylmuramoyl-L-alanine amidase